jgi:hypothetical protein
MSTIAFTLLLKVTVKDVSAVCESTSIKLGNRKATILNRLTKSFHCQHGKGCFLHLPPRVVIACSPPGTSESDVGWRP